MSEIREEFKKWLAEQTGNQHAIDDYKTAAQEFAWRAWQAALQSVEGEPVGYLTNQAVARLQSDKKLNGEHLYAFTPDDMSKFRTVYLHPPTDTRRPTAYAVFTDSGKIRLWSANGGHVDDLRERYGSRLQPLYLSPTTKESLTVPRPTRPRHEVQAEALEAFGRNCGLFDSAYDDQEHIEIPRWRFKEYIARLRSNGGES